MKVIGTTPEGNYIIEASPDEHRALDSLALVLDLDRQNSFVRIHNHTIDFDLTKPLVAINTWRHLHDVANGLRELADSIEKAIQKKAAQ